LPLDTTNFLGATEDDVRALIQRHLEPDPFIVPPVLLKTALMREPILRLVWGLAFETLSAASEVVFVGYSLPVTDIATTFMLQESLGLLDLSKIKVVGRDSARKADIIDSYRRVFPGLPDEQFRWDGALSWAAELTASDPVQQELPIEGEGSG
jgi:hypothetical protein